jgi:geranylgeranyl reductase family protein
VTTASQGPPDAPRDTGGTVRTVTTDVVVVGGGPAGSSAAIELVRTGRRVAIVDKATFPRDKCCGDGLTTLALRELEVLGFDPGAVPDWFDVDDVVLRSPSGRAVDLPLPGTGRYAAVAPRLQLDDALVELARTAGVDVHEGCRVADVTQDDESVTVRSGSTTFRARYVVAADGMWSPVRKALGLDQPGYLGEWHGFRQYAGDVTGPAARQLFVWFEPDLIPGYAWSFPLPGGRANVGFGVLRDGSRRTGTMAALWSDLLQRPHVVAALGEGFSMEGRHTAWPIPARVDEAVLSSGRVLFVGDAAGATDVMTGEGIGQALLTGRLAAGAITAGGALRPAEVRQTYELAVRQELLADHRMSKVLGGLLAKEWGARGALRVVAGSGAWGRGNFARWMFEDEPRAIALTPRRWHRRFLDRPGAYADAAERI